MIKMMQMEMRSAMSNLDFFSPPKQSVHTQVRDLGGAFGEACC